MVQLSISILILHMLPFLTMIVAFDYHEIWYVPGWCPLTSRIQNSNIIKNMQIRPKQCLIK